MSREACAAETDKSGFPDRLAKLLLCVNFRGLKTIVKPHFSVGFYRNALNHCSVRELNVSD